MPREPTQRPGDKLKALIASLDDVMGELPAVAKGLELNDRALTKLSEKLGIAAEVILKVAHQLDPIRRPQAVFDPSNPGIVGRMIALTLTAQERVPLTDLKPFYGSGIYAIYYNGDFEPYRPLVRTEHPIYVGKADPANPKAGDPVEQGQKVYKRLDEHLRSIKQTELRPGDFQVRYLVVSSGWQAAAENYMIRLMKPIWNSEVKIAYGLGKHGDSADTRGNKRSPWDTLHPGRGWARNTAKDQKPRETVLKEIATHFLTETIYDTKEAIFREFMLEMSQLPEVTSEPLPAETDGEELDPGAVLYLPDLAPLPAIAAEPPPPDIHGRKNDSEQSRDLWEDKGDSGAGNDPAN
jgi:hypothetical protein